MNIAEKLGAIVCSLIMFSNCNFAVAEATSSLLVPLVHLLVDPTAYDGESVKTMGFMSRITPTRQQSLLYLTRDHALMHDFVSALQISESKTLRESNCSGRYVYVVGVLVVDDYNQASLRASEVIDASTKQSCWREQ